MLSISSGKFSLSDAFSSSRTPFKVRANMSGHLETQAEHSLSCFHLYMKQCDQAMCEYFQFLQFYKSLYVLENSEFVHTLQ